MKKRRTEHKFRNFVGKLLPYAVMFLTIVGIAKVGSESKNELALGSLSMDAMAASDYNVSADQLSALYIVASLSDSFDLASIDTVASNYVVVSAMKEISQTAADKIEKPSMIATVNSRGVQTHIVEEGQTMEWIAYYYGLSTDQIRWSNGLKTTNVTVGQILKLPATSGIVYTTKAGDTPESLASRYGSSAERIIAQNDLEGTQIVEGMQIVLPGGVLPNTERPEYVAPTPSYATYTYSGSSYARQNLVVISRGAYAAIYDNPVGINGNPMTRGQCTWYAWYWRAINGNPLPGGSTLGHARTWAVRAATMGYAVDNVPRAGDVFQTTAGYYGHVGIVLAVNSDGSLLVREMNLDSRGAGTLTEGIIPANAVSSFNYIH